MSETVTREEADDVLWAEVAALLTQLDQISGDCNYLIGEGDGLWRIVNGTSFKGYQLRDGLDAPDYLQDIRDKLREMVSPPEPEEQQAAEETESDVTRLKLRVDALEKEIAIRNETIGNLTGTISRRNETITKLRETSVPKEALIELIDHEGS